MSYTTDGLVLNVRATGENDKLLTLLTPQEGRISVMVKGGRSLKSGSLPATQLFAYGNYELNYRGEFKWLRGASSERQFSGLSESIKKIALASYFASVADELSGENEPAEDILRLTLNAFFALEKGKKPASQIKAAFEMRAATIAGFMPDLSACRGCHSAEADIFYLDVMNGRLLCSDCMRLSAQKTLKEQAKSEDMREAVVMLPMSPSVTVALRYITAAEPNRFLSFTLTDGELLSLGRVSETYLLSHLGHGFDTLEFYKILTKD